MSSSSNYFSSHFTPSEYIHLPLKGKSLALNLKEEEEEEEEEHEKILDLKIHVTLRVESFDATSGDEYRWYLPVREITDRETFQKIIKEEFESVMSYAQKYQVVTQQMKPFVAKTYYRDLADVWENEEMSGSTSFEAKQYALEGPLSWKTFQHDVVEHLKEKQTGHFTLYMCRVYRQL